MANAAWSFEEHQRFCFWLIPRIGAMIQRAGKPHLKPRGYFGLFASSEVISKIVTPFVWQWREREPLNAEAHFCMGMYGRNTEHPEPCLREAIRLDPSHGRARVALAWHIQSYIEYNQHELPSGYINAPESDLTDIQEAEALIAAQSVDQIDRKIVQDALSICRLKAETWLRIRDELRPLDWNVRVARWRAALTPPA